MNRYWPRSGDVGSSSNASTSRRRGRRGRRRPRSRRPAGQRGERAQREAEPRTEARPTSSRGRVVEGIEPGAEERLRESGTASVAEVAGQAEPPADLGQRAPVEQHANGLDGVQRDARGAVADRRARASGGCPARARAAACPSPRRSSGARSSRSVVADGRPRTSGASSMSSGRARARTRIGRFRAAPSRPSMKSSSPAIRPVEVLEHEHGGAVGRRSARTASARPPVSSSALPAGRVARPRRAARRGSTRARSSGSGRYSAAISASFARAASGGSSDSAIRARPPDHLAERPEREAVAVGRRAALVPVDDLDQCRRCTSRAPRRAGSCRCPASPSDRDQPRPAGRGPWRGAAP